MNVVNFGSLNIDHVYAVDHFCRAGKHKPALRYVYDLCSEKIRNLYHRLT